MLTTPSTDPDQRTHQLYKLSSHLVDAGCAGPVDHIYQLPGILVEYDLQLPIFIHGELSGRKQNARALFLVRGVYPQT